MEILYKIKKKSESIRALITEIINPKVLSDRNFLTSNLQNSIFVQISKWMNFRGAVLRRLMPHGDKLGTK